MEDQNVNILVETNVYIKLMLINVIVYFKHVNFYR